MSNISFDPLIFDDKATIFSWLEAPHVQEFWDNTPEHKQDIENFMEGRVTPSTYFDGEYVYWIAKIDGQPFSMIMTILETSVGDIEAAIKYECLSQTGNTYSLDYMIGSLDFVGRGYGASTLKSFMDFFRAVVDKKADTFFIDPEKNNTRAIHVYKCAGFEYIGDFVLEGNMSGSGKTHQFFVKYFGTKNGNTSHDVR